MKHHTLYFSILTTLLVVLMITDLIFGSIQIPLSALWDSTIGVQHQIMLHMRLTRMLTAVLAGAALSVSGLMMQTLFRNPLAGPSVLGVSSGATLGVATLIMASTTIGFAPTNALTAVFAIIGAMIVLLTVLAVSYRVESNVSLLIVGMMIGSIAGALVNVMQNYSNPDSLKLFIVWTLGSLQSVSWTEMQWLVPMVAMGLVVAICMIKPLNNLLLGENYARGLGVNITKTRFLLILSTGLLAGGVTAFCGPIAFIGVAVPHIARGILRTSNHHLTLPACALTGACLLLICDILSSAATYPLPISTVSSIFGAPIIIYIILKK